MNGNIKVYTKQGNGTISNVWNAYITWNNAGYKTIASYTEFMQNNTKNIIRSSNSLCLLGENGNVNKLVRCSFSNDRGSSSLSIYAFTKTNNVLEGDHYFGSIRPVIRYKE